MNPISNDFSSTAFNSTAAQAINSQSGQDEIAAVGKEFESVFLSMMLKEMRNSLETGFFAGENSDSYGGMFDMFIGKHMAESSPLGIGEMLLQQYTKTQASGDQTQSAESVDATVSLTS